MNNFKKEKNCLLFTTKSGWVKISASNRSSVHDVNSCCSTLYVSIYWHRIVRAMHTVKKVSDFPVPSRDVNNPKLSLSYSRPWRVWLVTSRLGMRKLQSFFDSVVPSVQYTLAVPSANRRNSPVRIILLCGIRIS